MWDIRSAGQKGLGVFATSKIAESQVVIRSERVAVLEER